MIDEWSELKAWLENEKNRSIECIYGAGGWAAFGDALHKVIELEGKKCCRSLEAAGY